MLSNLGLGKYAKAIVAGLGLLVLVANTILTTYGSGLPPTWSAALSGVVAVATTVATYLTPNSAPDAPAPPVKAATPPAGA